jgi:endoglucanase
VFTKRPAALMLLVAALVGWLALPEPAAAQAQPPICRLLPVLQICHVQPAPVPPPDPRGVDPSSPNPLLGLSFFVDPQEPSYREVARYLRSGDTLRARQMLKLAGQPKFRWFGRFNRNLERAVRDYIWRAAVRGQVPLLVTLRHQGKRCNRSYTAGGNVEDARTMRWFDSFARAVGRSRVVIGFEPDSIGTVECLARSRRRARLDVLRYGVDVLSRLPNATIYLEGAASDWKRPAVVAARLRYIGVAKVRGFMVNATHYDWTAKNIRYGLDISNRLGGKPFIVSTAENGRGPVHYMWHRWRIAVQCHPRFRGLGPPPTTRTSNPKVDAYLWVNRPGYSGGRCNGGPMPIGRWWRARALMFTRYATSWERPPPRTRFGFPSGRLSLKAAAGDQLTR